MQLRPSPKPARAVWALTIRMIRTIRTIRMTRMTDVMP
jgi:hypothetical protein